MDESSWDRSPSLPIPLDILLDVVHHLPIQNIPALRQVCIYVSFCVILKSDFLLFLSDASRPVKVFTLSRVCVVSGLSSCELMSKSKMFLYPTSVDDHLI